MEIGAERAVCAAHYKQSCIDFKRVERVSDLDQPAEYA